MRSSPSSVLSLFLAFFFHTLYSAAVRQFIRIAGSCLAMIAEKCGADVVQVIGSKFVLYRMNPDEPKITLPKAKKR